MKIIKASSKIISFCLTTPKRWNPVKSITIENHIDVRTFTSHKNKPDDNPKYDLRYALKQFNEDYRTAETITYLKLSSKNGTKKPTIFIFPGSEGHKRTVEPLSNNLDANVICIQYPFECANRSIPELADNVTKEMKHHLIAGEPVRIFGHSFGGMVAFETVYRLEQEKHKVHICVTDGTPYAIKQMNKACFGDIQHLDDFENRLLKDLLIASGETNIPQLEGMLKKYDSWNSKIQNVFNEMSGNTKISKSNLQIMFTGIYNRIFSVLCYPDDVKKLKARGTLICSTIKLLPFPSNFMESKYFESQVTNHTVEAHHLNILKYKETADLVMDSLL